MVRRAFVPRSLVVAAVAAASFTPAGRAGAANMVGVTVRDSNFTPGRQTIYTGDTVVFAKAQDSQLTHSVTSDTGAFDSELADKRYIGLRFQQPGTYAYHCKYHGSAGGGGMSGVIFVQDAATTTTTATTGPPPPTTTTTGPGSTTTTTGPATTTTTTKPPTTTTTKPPK
ncbi:MAG TPA: cupredoxin domain-containing protein, partial [Acidimicrobiia bacterium]|nr:cupredoxin domain-containing protein [Acidimicrobiia bacterium]